MNSESEIQPLPLKKLSDVKEEPEAGSWLIHSLWSASAVGIVGGEPKTYKTWLTGELVHAVASGHNAFGRFHVEQPGPVLIFHQEDGQQQIRARLSGISLAHGTEIADLPIHFIDVPTLYLDDAQQIRALRLTIAQARPRLIVLDPFVRLVRGLDENSANDVARVLGELRRIQRELDVAVLLVHHMRKARSSHPGHQLRGSGDFAAWTDSAIYVARRGNDRILTIEHRSRPAPSPIRVRLAQEPMPHLIVVDAEQTGEKATPSLADTILAWLQHTASRQPTIAIRDATKARKASVVEALRGLESAGKVERNQQGWALKKPVP